MFSAAVDVLCTNINLMMFAYCLLIKIVPGRVIKIHFGEGVFFLRIASNNVVKHSSIIHVLHHM